MPDDERDERIRKALFYDNLPLQRSFRDHLNDLEEQDQRELIQLEEDELLARVEKHRPVIVTIEDQQLAAKLITGGSLWQAWAAQLLEQFPENDKLEWAQVAGTSLQTTGHKKTAVPMTIINPFSQKEARHQAQIEREQNTALGTEVFTATFTKDPPKLPGSVKIRKATLDLSSGGLEAVTIFTTQGKKQQETEHLFKLFPDGSAQLVQTAPEGTYCPYPGDKVPGIIAKGHLPATYPEEFTIKIGSTGIIEATCRYTFSPLSFDLGDFAPWELEPIKFTEEELRIAGDQIIGLLPALVFKEDRFDYEAVKEYKRTKVRPD